jgi:hypothetical protein
MKPPRAERKTREIIGLSRCEILARRKVKGEAPVNRHSSRLSFKAKRAREEAEFLTKIEKNLSCAATFIA